MTQTDTHTTIATVCRKTGRSCPAAARAADQLTRAARQACATAPDFAMTGQLPLTGCDMGCAAMFNLTATQVEVFCGVAADADVAALSAFASDFLNSHHSFAGLGGLDAAPYAFVRTASGQTPAP